MAEGVRCSLLRCLEHLTPEELKKFKLYLQDHPVGRRIPRGRLEGADRAEVTALLVSYQGEQEAWDLTLNLWEKMGLRELWERARAEGPQGTAEGTRLQIIQDERNEYQERIREKFQHIRDRNSRPGEHEPFEQRFTQLLFLQNYRYKEEKQHELLVNGREHAKFMEERGQFTEVSDLFDPDPKTGDTPRTVVLQGAAGIGKTTLARKVILDWAEGKLYQKKFDWVFYLSCRELNPLGERETSFADLIANDWPGPQAPITEIMSQSERILFIIDGLDELKFPCNEHRHDLCKDWKEQRPVPILISSILRKILLPKASLLLTTRLTALGKFSPLLENTRHVEILGFSEEQRKEYFCKFFRDEDLGKKAFKVVEDNDILFTMCSVPLMSWIVCTCLIQRMKTVQDPVQALKTTTALYIYYLSNLMPPDDKTFALQHLRSLCCLAAEGIWEKKLLFDEEDLRRHGLEATNISAFLDLNIFQKDIDCENCYSFIHLSFQEFFAAMFYVMPSAKEGMDIPDSSIPDVKTLLEKCGEGNDNFVVIVVHFLFGFVNSEMAKEMERKFRCRMSIEIKSQLLQWIKGTIKRKYGPTLIITGHLPKLYSYLYETQEAEFVTLVLSDTKEIFINVLGNFIPPIAIFFLKLCTKAWRISFVSSLHLPVGVWKDLFFVISKNQNLKEIKFEGHYSDNPHMEINCIKQKNQMYDMERLSCKSLKRNPVNSVLLEDVGMKLPRENFGNKNSQLETLTINHIHCPLFLAFSFLFLLNERLKKLKVSFTDLGAYEINLLCKALEKQGCKLQTLSLCSCKVTFPGHLYFLAALQKNDSLENLCLSNNFFEEEAMTFLSKVLGNQNCNMNTLSLTNCKIPSRGYQLLFSALHSNKSLKTLDLCHNCFEEEEIKIMCKALENPNCQIETLSLESCKITSRGYQNLFSALQRNESLKTLELSYISFAEREIKVLCKALENSSCKIETLSFWSCKVTSLGYQNLFSVLHSNKSLKTLNLIDNYFEEEEIDILCKALENPNGKLEELSVRSCKFPHLSYQNLFSALRSNESLKTLNLSKNFFEEAEIKVLCEVLENQNCKLETLTLIESELPVISFQYFLSVILKNKNLKVLELTYIANSDEGWKSKNFKFQSNKNLKTLDLQYSSFNEGEIKALCMALENPDCKLETLSLGFCKIPPLSYQNLFFALHSYESLKTLDLSYNSFEEEEIKVLCKALENQNCKLEELRLLECSLPDTSCQYFISTLLKNESLKVLKLSYSSFGSDTFRVFSEALKSDDSKLQRLRLARDETD